MAPVFGDRSGTTKKLCDRDFAERSGELSGAICLKTLVPLGTMRAEISTFRISGDFLTFLYWD